MAKTVIYDGNNSIAIDTVRDAITNEFMDTNEVIAIMDTYLSSHLSTSGSGNVTEVQGLGELFVELIMFARQFDYDWGTNQ